MTIAPVAREKEYLGDGSTVLFAVPFQFIATSDLRIALRDADDNETVQTLGIDYSVAGGNSLTGSVTFTVAPPRDITVVIKGAMPLEQPMTLTPNSTLPAGALERAYDRGMIAAQELDARVGDLQVRTLQLPPGSIAPSIPGFPSDPRVLGFAGGLFVWTANNAAGVAADVERAEDARDQAGQSAIAAAEALAEITAKLALTPARAVKSIAQSIASTTGLVSDADLRVPIGVNALVVLRGRINYSTVDAADFKWRHTGPSGAVSVQINRRAIAPGDTAYSGVAIDTAYSAADISVLGATGYGTIEFDGTIANGATAGNFIFQWAQNTSNAGATRIEAGSFIEIALEPHSANFALSSTAIAKLGDFPASTSGGHNYVTANQGVRSYLETIVTGSKCEAQLDGEAPSQNYTVTIDDGAPFVVSPAAAWTWTLLFKDLSDTPHRVRIQGVFFDSDITFRVAGVTPSLTRPADVPNTYVLRSTPFTTYGQVDGVSQFNNNLSTSVPQCLWAASSGFGPRFRATTTSIRAYLYDGLNPSRVIVLRDDGVIVGDITPPGTTGGYKLFTLATGLSATSHEYEILPISAGRGLFMWQILVDTLENAAVAVRPIHVHYGDSIVAEGNTAAGAIFDARLGDAYLIARAKGRCAIRVGAGGTQLSTYGRDNTATVTNLPGTLAVISVRYGTNDAWASIPVATFKADYVTTLTRLRTGAATALIEAWAILPTKRTSDATIALYNAAIAEAVIATGDTNMVYIDTTTWINKATDLDDSVHPSASGYAKIAAAYLASQ